MSTRIRSTFEALVDDAAMFPPGNASAEIALAEHLRYRASWFSDLVGPLLVPAGAWDTFLEAHRVSGGPAVEVVLIGTAALPGTPPPGVSVLGFEVSVPDVPLPETGPNVTLAAEITVGAAGGRVLADVAEQVAAGRPVVAKFRTGGTSADAFPSEDLLAGVLIAAAGAGAPLKLTAGLHHAARFTDPTTGFEHHGFLNVLVAVARVLAGSDRQQVVDGLAQRDAADLAQEVAALPPENALDVRRHLVSFGCCGVEDPINDLVALGLVDETPPDRADEEPR